jgi:signal transduction histidine kinase
VSGPGPAIEAALRAEITAVTESVAHVLRSPLWAIEGVLEPLMTQAEAGLPPAVLRDLELALAAARRCLRALEGVSRLASLENQAGTPGPVDLSAEFQTLAAALQAAAPARAVAVSVQPGLHVWTDLAVLRLALQPLLENAWIFTRESPQPRIECGAEPAASGAPVFFVRDNGVGFDPVHAEELFHPFRRFHSPRHYDGLGMGLAIARRALHILGGTVWAEGQPGAGATFRFTLPAAPGPAELGAAHA